METAVPTRRLGRTNESVSMVAMGGFHIGFAVLSDVEAVHLIHRAIDAGITFLDNCWDYNGGESEVRMGRALATSGYRERVFLMTKIDGRTARRRPRSSTSRCAACKPTTSI